MMWHDAGWGWGAWLGMGIFMVLFWGVVAAAVVLLVRRPGEHQAPPAPRDEAMNLLAQRFAAGEIDEDEYRHRRDVLRA